MASNSLFQPIAARIYGCQFQSLLSLTLTWGFNQLPPELILVLGRCSNEAEILAGECSNEAEVLRLNGQQQFVAQRGAARVERYVEARDASVGGGEVGVVRGADGNRGHGLEPVLGGGERGRARPEVDLGGKYINH